MAALTKPLKASLCTLTLVQTPRYKDLVPAVTTRFDSDDAVDFVNGLQVAKLDIVKQTITLLLIHDTQMKLPKLFRIPINVLNKAVSRFLPEYYKSPIFLWILSTPSSEFRIYVNTQNNFIEIFDVVNRVLH